MSSLLAVGLLAGCTIPYKMDVVQGNFVSSEQIAALQPGMPKAQVQDILGTPLLVSVFRPDQWQYVFTYKRPGSDPILRKFTVYFKNGAFDHLDGDKLPTEAEFVNQIDKKTGTPSIPPLKATPDQLRAFAQKNAEGAPGDAEAGIGTPSGSPKVYPSVDSSAGAQ